MARKLPTRLTLPYRNIHGMEVELDLYLPPEPEPGPERQSVSRSTTDSSRLLLPCLVYFHGGGLTVGEKTSWFPFWIYDRAVMAGYAFISVNYQLVPPANGHDIIKDIKCLFAFLGNGINDACKAHRRGRGEEGIDVERVAVMGTSAGGLCAYLAGIHAVPKPRAVVSVYGMGGNFFTRHYLEPKTVPFFRGRELLDPETFSEFIFPRSRTLSPVVSSPLSYYGADHPIPGYPSNPRMLLARLYLQLGTFLDYYTGEEEEDMEKGGISRVLRDRLDVAGEEKEGEEEDIVKPPDSWASLIPPIHHPLFPQLNISAFPPTFFIHGSQDTAVPIHDSYHLHKQLQSSGIESVLKVCPGMEHTFDYEPDAEQMWSGVFDEAFSFLEGRLSSLSSEAITRGGQGF